MAPAADPERSGAVSGSDDAAAPALPTGISGMVERQIRQAQERGAFDDLPGAGRPLRGLGGPHDENWWLQQHLLREGVSGAAFLPPALALRKEAEELPELVRALPTEAQVRTVVTRLNERILDALRKPAQGPPMTVMPLDEATVVLGWRLARITARAAARRAAADAAEDDRNEWDDANDPAPAGARRRWFRRQASRRRREA